MKTSFLALVFLLAASPVWAETPAKEPIQIGFLSSLTGLANEAQPLDNGALLAVEEINARGGALGRPLEIIFRDDKNSPSAAVTEAQRLDQESKVPVLVGTILDNTGQAVLNYAGQAKIPFVKPTGGTDDFVWKEGNRYSFRNDASTDTLGAMLAREAAKNPAKRWAVVAPNYVYGHSMYAAFKKHLARLRPDVVWVSEQFPNYGKIDAGSTVQLLKRAKPDAILTLIIQDDLIKFVRNGQKRGLLQNLYVVAPYMGWPEFLTVFKQEMPQGWLTNGFPFQSVKEPALKSFVDAYEARFKETPGASSLNGYTSMYFVAAALNKAGTLEREKIRDALEGLSIASPVGSLTMRAIDHQSNYGAWVGKTGFIDKTPTIVDWHYEDAAPYFPPDSVTRTLRPDQGEKR